LLHALVRQPEQLARVAHPEPKSFHEKLRCGGRRALRVLAAPLHVRARGPTAPDRLPRRTGQADLLKEVGRTGVVAPKAERLADPPAALV
jgi:hypothetical protein